MFYAGMGDHLSRSLKGSSPLLLQWHVCGGSGERMAVTVQRPFELVILEMSQDACVGSSIDNGTTIITFNLRKLDFPRTLGATSPVCWRKNRRQRAAPSPPHHPRLISQFANCVLSGAPWKVRR